MIKTYTYRDRLIAGLLAMGYQETKNTVTTKYTVFRHDDFTQWLFVGKYGALRRGNLDAPQSSTKSHSLGDNQHQTAIYRQVLEAGDKELRKRNANSGPSPSAGTGLGTASQGMAGAGIGQVGSVSESTPDSDRSGGDGFSECPECGKWTQQGKGCRCLDCQEKAGDI